MPPGRRPLPHNRRRANVVVDALGTLKTALDAAIAAAEGGSGFRVRPEHKIIGDAETFREWCERLGRDGLKVDGKPFRLDDRPAMAWIYDQVPSTREEAKRKTLVLMKCAQVGFTVMEMLAVIYLGLKFGPATVGMFLPDMNLAGIKSSERFMPIVRSVPDVHALMTQDAADGSGRKAGEGNVTRRRIGGALFIISWTSGRATTESVPMDVLSFDEVQEMTLEQMEKTGERLSASEIKYTLMGSTANWPDSDIHHWFKQGTQHEFHTECPTCAKRKPLVDYFPECIRWDPATPDAITGAMGTHRYVCEDGHWIDDTQRGEWIAKNPGAWIVSCHFPQFLSPTISASEIMQKYVTSTDKKNFNNRVLGRPYLDPTQIPVTLEHMANCVEAGKEAGIKWKVGARQTFMGIDQMGAFNVHIIKERLPDGRQAVVHVEFTYSDDPFLRSSELMDQYGVQCAVVELNPNYNDAKRFANRHPGRVFICNSFGSLPEDMIKWGDGPKLDVSERRTDEEERDRWTVRIDQYKCMQASFARFTVKEPICLWPDPQELTQDIVEKGLKKHEAIAPHFFHHFTKTALVAEKDEETNSFKRSVKKVGIDPHGSYANLLADVAWARAHGTATFIMPEAKKVSQERRAAAVEMNMPGLPGHVVAMMEERPSGHVCGSCISYPLDDQGGCPARAACSERSFIVAAVDPACDWFVSAS